MTKVLIIDDEPHARQTIRAILQFRFPQVNIVGEVSDVASAITAIAQSQPDLLFLDIDLPDGTGFDILKSIGCKSFRVIFVTAYQEYAIQAIKFSALDYILKPINPKELVKAVENSLAVMQSDEFPEKIQAFFANFSSTPNEPKRIVLKTADKLHVIEVKNIIRCESDNAYTTVFTDTDKIVVSKSIKYYDELLTNFGFMRVHQSHLVNPNCITFYNKHEGGYLTLTDNSSVPVSNQKKPILLNYLEAL